MAKKRLNPVEQKTQLLNQLKEIESKLADFDKQRAVRIGQLAKKYRLVDLEDAILETEFKLIREKHKMANLDNPAAVNEAKKNS